MNCLAWLTAVISLSLFFFSPIHADESIPNPWKRGHKKGTHFPPKRHDSHAFVVSGGPLHRALAAGNSAEHQPHLLQAGASNLMWTEVRLAHGRKLSLSLSLSLVGHNDHRGLCRPRCTSVHRVSKKGRAHKRLNNRWPVAANAHA